jgi:hypothetical protein
VVPAYWKNSDLSFPQRQKGSHRKPTGGDRFLFQGVSEAAVGRFDPREELDDFYDEIPRGVKANRKEFHEKYLSGREFDRFFNKLKASKMEMENMGGGDKSWAWTVSPQPQPVIDPDTAIKDEEVVVKMEEIDINMEDVEEKVRKTTRDEEIVEGERSPKRHRVE